MCFLPLSSRSLRCTGKWTWDSLLTSLQCLVFVTVLYMGTYYFILFFIIFNEPSQFLLGY